MAMVPGEVRRNGTLVVASARDLGELRRFACRTTGYEWLEEAAIATLEPSLARRFRHGLFFRREAHLDPGRVLCLLRTKLTAQGVTFVGKSPHESFDSVVDCTGARASARPRTYAASAAKCFTLEAETWTSPGRSACSIRVSPSTSFRVETVCSWSARR